jgi:hypothetical protein
MVVSYHCDAWPGYNKPQEIRTTNSLDGRNKTEDHKRTRTIILYIYARTRKHNNHSNTRDEPRKITRTKNQLIPIDKLQVIEEQKKKFIQKKNPNCREIEAIKLSKSTNKKINQKKCTQPSTMMSIRKSTTPFSCTFILEQLCCITYWVEKIWQPKRPITKSQIRVYNRNGK